jgi:hypothetical protein
VHVDLKKNIHSISYVFYEKIWILIWIKRYIDYIIHPDQTGFIKGRNLSQNIRSVYDIMQYTEEENIPDLLLIGFEKALDSISLSFIQKTLHSLILVLLHQNG